MSIFKEFIDNHNFEHLINTENVNRGIPPEIEQLHAEFNGEYTPKGMFFISPFVLYADNSEISIPVIDSNTYKQGIEEIAGHFSKARKMTKGTSIELMLKDLKSSSRESFIDKFNAGKLPSFIIDIYGSDVSNKKKTVDLSTFDTKLLELDLEQVDKKFTHEVAEIWEFISSTFLKVQEYYLFIPCKWQCNEELKNHIAIQNFASVCEKIWFSVNVETNEITSVALR
ncbi:hypothetical protein [Paenibacillus odorifer]|uniref:hypothetical protein n=1 Tax=Paenibacillus odorifer TaxID=189426 RepID=UPI00096C353A|nr:hypothetical protein [Paenibacillus odorifer]OMD10609.1 hypothetical protein BJP50_28250 [Paenibacillus odorifer]